MMASERNIITVVTDIIATRQLDINAKNTEGLTALYCNKKKGILKLQNSCIKKKTR